MRGITERGTLHNPYRSPDACKQIFAYSPPMGESDMKTELDALSAAMDRALEALRTLREENDSLRHSREQLAAERAQLLSRNEQARSRVEAMIERLKALENAG